MVMTAINPIAMNLPKRIFLKRLCLVQLGQQYSQALFENQFQDQDNLKFMTMRPHEALADTQQYIVDSNNRWEAGDRMEYAIEWRDTGQVVGTLAAYPSGGRVSLGVVVSRGWSSRGVAVEATQGLVAVLQRMPEVYRIWAYCDASHERSIATLLRCGFKEEGLVHDWAVFPHLGSSARNCLFFYYPKAALLPLPAFES